MARHSEQALSALTLYNVTLLPSYLVLFATTQKGGKNCKSAENQSYIKPDPKTIREKVEHDDNDNNNNNNNNNRDETTVPSHFTYCMANAMTDSYIRTSVNC